MRHSAFFLTLFFVVFGCSPATSGYKESQHTVNTCSVPVATNNGNAIAYDLDNIITSSGCEGGNFVLNFSANDSSVRFSCNPLSNAFLWWQCDLPVNAGKEYQFTFGDVDGSEDIVNIRSISPVSTECVGREVGLVFWATREGANTLCNDNADVQRGFSDVHFTNKKGRVIFTAK